MSNINKNQVYIKTPDKVHNNFGLCIFLKNKHTRIIKDFKIECKHLLNSHNIQWFLQGGSDLDEDEWAYFEIWQDIDHDLLLSIGEEISNLLHLPLEIE